MTKGRTAAATGRVVAMSFLLVACILGTCLVPGVGAAGGDHHAVVLASGEVVQSENELNMTASNDGALIQTASGAAWSIKLPSCPSDLNICCAFFQNWNWGYWSRCASQALNVGKAILKKALELLDWITDAQKLTRLVLSGPVGRKLWQLWDWGKKALKALVEAVENVVEGLVKVVMAIVRLVLALPKIPGCWGLSTSRRDFLVWSGSLLPTDCGALSTLKKVNMWGFFKSVGGCFIRFSRVPHNSGIPLPTPFLNRHDLSVCTYHIPPILAQLANGFVQIVKAIVTLFLDVVILQLQLVDILVAEYIRDTVLYTLLHNVQMLFKAVKDSMNGNPPATLESITGPPPVRRRRRRRWSWWRSASSSRASSSEGLDEKVEKVEVVEEAELEVPQAFRAAVQRELDHMDDHQAVVEGKDSKLIGSMMQSHDLSRAALAQLMGSHQQEHPEMWTQLQNDHQIGDGETPSAAAEQEDEEDGSSAVDRWAMAVAKDMDMQSTVDALMAVALAESGGAQDSGFVMTIGAAVSCVGTFDWKSAMPWKLPLISSAVSVSVGFSLQAGQTLETKSSAPQPHFKQHFSVGLKLAATMALATSIDIGSPGVKFGPANTADPLKKMCDNEKLTSFTVAPGYTGTSCAPSSSGVDVSGMGKGVGVFGWSFGFAMPMVIKALAGILCGLVGGPVSKCIDMTPGDLIHFASGYADLTKKDKWFFKAGFNLLFTKFDVEKPFWSKRMSLLKISFALSRSHSIFFGVPCQKKSRSSSLVASVRVATKARLQSSCDTLALAKSSCSHVDQQSATSVARCVQQSLNARLACGGGAEMEALHAEDSPAVVDASFGVHFNGQKEASSGGIRVRVQGAWLSGLSRMEVAESTGTASLLSSGVRTAITLRSKGAEAVQLRQVCLQWSSVETTNAFRELTGSELSVKQRTRQMASALERKVDEAVGATANMEATTPSESASMSEWAAFLRHLDSQSDESSVVAPHELAHVSSGSSTNTGEDGDVRKCFKLRIGSVSATLETSLQGDSMKAGAFDATGATLHSFAIANGVAENVEQQVLASAPMAAAVESLFASMAGAPPSALAAAKQQLTVAVAKKVATDVESALTTSLCQALSSVVCPNCQAESSTAWESRCGAVAAVGLRE